jgi:hypothetical protein
MLSLGRETAYRYRNAEGKVVERDFQSMPKLAAEQSYPIQGIERLSQSPKRLTS